MRKEIDTINSEDNFWQRINQIDEQIAVADNDLPNLISLLDQKYLLFLLGLEKQWVPRIPKDKIWEK